MTRIPFWLKAIPAVVVSVLLVRMFAFTSCTIPSTGMENSLYPGERVLVGKWSYGFRVPFSTWRWASRRAERGDMVLFNNPDPPSLHTAVSNRELFISRCVGVPGDTLLLNGEWMVMGGQMLSPDSKSLYAYPCADEDLLSEAMARTGITGNHLVGYAEGRYIRSFSRYEFYLLTQKLGGKAGLLPLYGENDEQSRPFVIPSKGKAVAVHPRNAVLHC